MINIYNTMVLLSDFYKYHKEIEEIVNITPAIEYLKDESDKLCYNFTNIKLEF